MNTFLNIKTEFGHDPFWKGICIQDLKKFPLHTRINTRGENEQYNSVMRTHYFPEAAKRRRRTTAMRNSKIHGVIFNN